MPHRPNPFRQCLEELDAAEDAWFEDKGLEKYAIWAKNNTGLLRSAMMMLADYVDSARRKAEDDRATSDNISPPPGPVYN
ncbi:hypothetical protein Q8W71_28845 [Methylobacterium sp. NEAU 140]|uniref:hypothetical protein n=1 Tax=Methylobacterium sp. NEAU 140 TaxID=3064945 RepID=UPI002732F67A|nr:hypothetical protein [Methylobacterium sp. NEAU 140]MDP4026621.1 hypothetical protein [Methylobacterium sp. NEAU 140]